MVFDELLDVKSQQVGPLALFLEFGSDSYRGSPVTINYFIWLA